MASPELLPTQLDTAKELIKAELAAQPSGDSTQPGGRTDGR